MPKASLAFLSYERPQFLEKAITTAIENAGTYDFEVIIHDDGSARHSFDILEIITDLRYKFGIEKVILKQIGCNEGVGKAINTSFYIAEGDYLFKLDQDLIFKKDWLKTSLDLLEKNSKIGLLGLFHYHFDPVDTKKTFINNYDDWEEHTHICGSGFAVPHYIYSMFGINSHSEAFAEDWELMKKLEKSAFYYNALPFHNLVENQGFGIGTSTVVTDKGVTKIHKELKKRG